VTGHLFEPQFSIVKLDKAGEGEVLCVSFQPGKSQNCDIRPRMPVLHLFFYLISCTEVAALKVNQVSLTNRFNYTSTKGQESTLTLLFAYCASIYVLRL